MAITTKLELRQSHSLVMTPQLQQAIKLLQLSNLELATFVEAELERNPLLEQAETDDSNGVANEPTAEPAAAADEDRQEGNGAAGETAAVAADAEASDGDDGEWLDLEASSGAGQADDLDAEPQDAFPEA